VFLHAEAVALVNYLQNQNESQNSLDNDQFSRDVRSHLAQAEFHEEEVEVADEW
jgi:hypothetical protein